MGLRAFKRPFHPVRLRDLLLECDITVPELGRAVGACEDVVRASVTRGYMPALIDGYKQRVESFLRGTETAREWIRRNCANIADLWSASPNKKRYLFNVGHSRRIKEGIGGGRKEISGQLRKLMQQEKRRRKIMEEGMATLAAFGYSRIPFEDVRIPTADGNTLKRLFKMAADSKAMVSIIASYGAGKSTAIETALDGLNCHALMLNLADKENMKIHDIERAMIRRLAPSENISRDRDTRARQVGRVVGEAGREKPVILIIEESHVMHFQTLRALKRIREYDWMGRRPLMAIILIGQYDKLKSASLAECHRGTRSDSYRLQGLAPSEARLYINETVGEHFEHEAVKAISELPCARNFLDLQEAIIDTMKQALSNGTKKVTILDVFATLGGGIKQLMEKYNLKASEVMDECKRQGVEIDKTAFSLIVNNRSHTLSPDKETSAKSAISEAIKTLIPHHGKEKKTELRAV